MSWVKKVWSRLFTEGAEDEAPEPAREPDTAEIERPKKAPFAFLIRHIKFYRLPFLI